MDPSTVCLSVFVALISMVAMFRIYKMNSFRIRVVGYRSQTMCHACHAITARAEANCQRCGKPLRAV
jgi:predicted amidophosphoribosyltransferase